MHAMDNGTAYLARAVSYSRKMLLKLITGGEDTKHVFFLSDEGSK
jgi:hypothetical protein